MKPENASVNEPENTPNNAADYAINKDTKSLLAIPNAC
jgi:hypothetical protein